jgi:hypothetical protein
MNNKGKDSVFTRLNSTKEVSTVSKDTESDFFSPRTDQNIGDIKALIRENWPDAIDINDTPLETAIKILKNYAASGSGQQSVPLGIPPAPSPDRDTVHFEKDRLRDDLDHTLDHLEIETQKMGSVVKPVFRDEMDSLAKKIAKLVLNYEAHGELSADSSAYNTVIRLGAMFNAIDKITTLLCADTTGGLAGETAKDMVFSALAGE